MGWLDDADSVIEAGMDAFSEAVTFEAPVVVLGAQPLSGRGKFDEAHEVVDVNGEAPVSSVSPVLTIRLAEFTTAPSAGNCFTVRGRRYQVYDTQPDGNGGLKLILKVKR